MFDFLKPTPPAKNKVSEDKIKNLYHKKRISVFISIYIGYAAYYMIRNNFTISEPYLIKYYGLDKATIGLILSCFAISYGISKLLMGILADKANSRYYIAIGLIISSTLNFCFGLTNNKYMMMLLMALIGITQGMGAPAAHKTLSVWFSKHEHGIYVSLWDTSHNIGSSIIPLFVTLSLTLFGLKNWHSIFFFPSIVSIILAIIVIILGNDTPESIGLPPIEEYHKENNKIVAAHNDIPVMKIIKNSILKRPYMWILAISNASMYIILYGIEDWIPIYLNTVKNFTFSGARDCFSLFEFAAIPGTILIGIISDKIFHEKRSFLSAILVLLLGITFTGYYLSTSHDFIIFTMVAMGILVYGPKIIIMLLAVDLTPKFAIGSIDGFLGLFGYIFGDVIASYIIGIVGWQVAYWIVIGAIVVSLICFIILIRAEHNADKQLNKIYNSLNI